jgi:hypothetical protein
MPVVSAISWKLRGNPGQRRATVLFKCPHCKRRHRKREICSAIPFNFSQVFYGDLPCGRGTVTILMPWAKPERPPVTLFLGNGNSVQV